ncbi:MAG: oxidase [Acidimicrobiales bacterium]|nr:MAG: oxidase [Acidimicrobiales bacterium]
MEALVSNTWYAVERSANLKLRPTTVERLGNRYVLWRSAAGVHAAPAQCPHRGADLGDGRVRNGCLTCPYHGIAFTGDGTAVHRPAQGCEEHIPKKAGLRTVPAVEVHGYVWIWHGDATPTDGPEWFDGDDSSVIVGADQTWDVHYSRFMESALDFHHVPFVHGRYAPGAGQRLTDIDLRDDGMRLSMSAALTNEKGRSLPVAGEVIMPCSLQVTIGATSFVAVGTPVDDHRTWVAANYKPSYTARIPGVRWVEAWLAMVVDFKLFQRQDRAIYEALDPGPSPLEHMALMPADRGAALWIRRWRELAAPIDRP